MGPTWASWNVGKRRVHEPPSVTPHAVRFIGLRRALPTAPRATVVAARLSLGAPPVVRPSVPSGPTTGTRPQSSLHAANHSQRSTPMDETTHQPQDLISRRSLMFQGAALGVGATAVGRLLVDPPDVFAKGHTKVKHGRLTKGDAAILRFLAAAEIIESDLWQQYNELAGIQDGEVPGGSGNDAYTEAVEVLDEDMNQYIHDNTDDEFSHVAFINAYLAAHGEKTVNLDKFRTLPSSQADGAQKNVGRLTNLMQLSVDTSFWTRYRSDTLNPDLGDTLPQAVPTLAVGEHPAIPRDNNDVNDANHLQAIANTAGFHFAFIAQGGTRHYPPVGGFPLRLPRGGRYEPLRLASAAGHQQGGAPDPAQHRRQRDHALPDLARQGRQRAAVDRRRPGLPGSECRW